MSPYKNTKISHENESREHTMKVCANARYINQHNHNVNVPFRGFFCMN